MSWRTGQVAEEIGLDIRLDINLDVSLDINLDGGVTVLTRLGLTPEPDRATPPDVTTATIGRAQVR